VRARFDDGTVGDVTFSDQLTFEPAVNFWLQEAGETHRIAIPADVPIGLPIDLTVTTSDQWGHREARGSVVVLDSWENTHNLAAAEWIGGHPQILDGTLRPQQVPNVLFLACGFSDASRAAFTNAVNLVVGNLTVDRLLQPYGYLAQSMNYWFLRLPGQADGVCVRCEVSPHPRPGGLFAKPVPSPAAPPQSGAWKLEHLIYMAGLPVPPELALVINKTTTRPLVSLDELRGLNSKQLNFDLLFEKWDVMMLEKPARNVSDVVVKNWLMLANRTFIDEIDTFPSMAIGSPPSAEFDQFGLLSLHDLRGGLDECRRFLSGVEAAPRPPRGPIVLDNNVVTEDGAPSTALGNLWATELANTSTFDNRQYLVLLCNAPFGRGNRVPDIGVHLRLYLKDAAPGIGVVQQPNANGPIFVAPDPNAILRSDTWRVFGHELAHAFGLGDEYVELAENYPHSEDDLDRFANLTTHPAILASGHPVMTQIKWNWHRIRYASVITERITSVGTGRFEVPVRPTRAPFFGPRNIVFLRERDPQVVINRDTTTLGPFEVETVSQAHDRVVIASRISGMDPAQLVDQVEAMFPNGIIYMPAPGLNSGQYFTLIPPAAARIMQVVIDGPMTGKTCNASEQTAHDGHFTQVPKERDPVGRVSAKDLPGLVGAYYGGRTYACGILHPAGQCLMRSDHDETTAFCPVCQYVLIEQIDPNQHFRFDNEYAKRYAL
jgi:hypothetical protein